MNPVLESLFKHRSIRKYKDQPLEDEKFNLIIKAAQAAPNWCNGQHVSIIAVKSKDRKAKLAELSLNQPYVASCSVFLVFCADYYRTMYAFEKSGRTEEEKNDYIKKLDNLFVGSHDVGIAMENAIVAAESMGLGTVPIGLIRKSSLAVIKELELPKYVIPLVGLCVGYPDDEPNIKPRLPSASVCFEETYDVNKSKAGVDEFDAMFRKYLSTRDSNNRDEDWSSGLAAKYMQFKDFYEDEYQLLEQQGFISIEKKN
ncbi:NADPH-FMN oxidoreductase [Neocallimastix lanati (nom. inval.)]|jgi:FMN reductase [NAD(P)H]|uniref:NADPH-FMN oxidoreductase n=1 Tax=Neocallimastix californiae TaxID=1754190 RepID=A0A1Y2ER23_9FUNG|nr:NADPH-FMN oxidoreductase [Neocallimastix sp. JGI-2020a]ORY73977.1 NADPH-FMN oxidoreductase [Neocallimastix californiae]|eukprot:ORY73977.1 NADPH-FMN oxidoreductase [Neocallimastix californiae]